MLHSYDQRSTIGNDEIEELKSYAQCDSSKEISHSMGDGRVINILLAILDLMELALKNKSIGYVHNLSGDDFLIKSPLEFLSFFQTNQDKIYMERIPCEGNAILEKRYRYYYFMHLLDAKLFPPLLLTVW